jgi:hypothetical protein
MLYASCDVSTDELVLVWGQLPVDHDSEALQVHPIECLTSQYYLVPPISALFWLNFLLEAFKPADIVPYVRLNVIRASNSFLQRAKTFFSFLSTNIILWTTKFVKFVFQLLLPFKFGNQTTHIRRNKIIFFFLCSNIILWITKFVKSTFKYFVKFNLWFMLYAFHINHLPVLPANPNS